MILMRADRDRTCVCKEKLHKMRLLLVIKSRIDYSLDCV